jgi:hypothetical protein
MKGQYKETGDIFKDTLIKYLGKINTTLNNIGLGISSLRTNGTSTQEMWERSETERKKLSVEEEKLEIEREKLDLAYKNSIESQKQSKVATLQLHQS